MRTLDVAVIGICAALYAAFGISTSQFSFMGVGFLPAVIVPAVFAVLFGPWVGGISGAIGIFIRDMFVHGVPLLSLSAGVPPNFILFFLIGYIAHRNISLKQALTGIAIAAVSLVAITVAFLPDFMSTLGASADFVYISILATVIPTLAIIAVVAVRWKEWRSYAIGAVLGQIAGAALLAVTLTLVSPYFMTTLQREYTAASILPVFVWTIITELPFILLAGPPIIKACYKAFPQLQRRQVRVTTLESS
ncbi:MAG: ECF transporter S component [Candidatus Bathyarchaeia archaeon]|jgi:hypothetical protein